MNAATPHESVLLERLQLSDRLLELVRAHAVTVADERDAALAELDLLREGYPGIAHDLQEATLRVDALEKELKRLRRKPAPRRRSSRLLRVRFQAALEPAAFVAIAAACAVIIGAILLGLSRVAS